MGNVGTIALMRIGRQYRQTPNEILQGERLENVLLTDEIRRLGKDLGKVAFNELARQGKDCIIDALAKKKNTDWNKKRTTSQGILMSILGKAEQYSQKKKMQARTKPYKIEEPYGMCIHHPQVCTKQARH